MSFESDLYTALGALVSNRAYPDIAPQGATLRGEAVGAFIADIDIELQRFGTIQDFRFVFND